MGFFDNLSKKASAAYDATAEKTGKLAKEAKFRMKINENKSDINDLYKEIGRKVYEKHIREENIDIKAELEEECTKIDVLSEEIETCLSEHSRNRRAGKLIGQGKTLEETKQEVGMVIESIDNIEVAHELGKLHNIEMPIVEAVYGILYEGLKPETAVDMLMNRAKKSEN